MFRVGEGEGGKEDRVEYSSTGIGGGENGHKAKLLAIIEILNPCPVYILLADQLYVLWEVSLHMCEVLLFVFLFNLLCLTKNSFFLNVN